MPEVPPELRRLFNQWDAAGRPDQRHFPWKRGGWDRWLPEHSAFIDELANPLGRASVAKWFNDISDEHSAVRGFLAASVWGFGDAGYGPYRTRAILDNNPSFSLELLKFAQLAQAQGGLAAFEHAVRARRLDRGYFKGYGPAFATKFIYFATKSASGVQTSPVMDKVVATWFRNNVPNVRLGLGWHSAESYRQYLVHLNAWAIELKISVDDVEQLIFTPGRPNGMETVKTSRPKAPPAEGNSKTQHLGLFSETDAELLKAVTVSFVQSRDFNGLPVTSIDAQVRESIEHLVEQGLIYANFGHVGVNPFIIMFPMEPPADNVALLRVRKEHLSAAVLYPTRTTMDLVPLDDRYHAAPYSKELFLAEAQIEPLYFDAAVLERYRNDPRFEYEFDIDGNIIRRDGDEEHRLTALGIGFHKDSGTPVVVALRRYLHEMPAPEQQHWHIHRIPDSTDYRLHPDFARPHYEGEFPEKLSPFSAVLAELDLANEMCAAIGWEPIFRKSFSEARPKNFGYLIRPTLREYQSFIHELDKMLSDNLSLTFLRERLGTDGVNENGGQIGSISLLDSWLQTVVRVDEENMVPSAIKLFKDVRKLRQRPAHASDADAWDHNYYGTQRENIVEAYYAVRAVRQVVGSHPKASSVYVPEELEEPKVWLF